MYPLARRASHRPLIILGAVLVFIIAVVVIKLITTPSSTPSSLPLPQTSISPSEIPISTSLTTDTVKMKNFYLTADIINQYGDAVFISNDNYHISYQPTNNLFLISITSAPFETIRFDAQQALITALDITEPEACYLNVDITTPSFANPDQAGNTYSLSFCP